MRPPPALPLVHQVVARGSCGNANQGAGAIVKKRDRHRPRPRRIFACPSFLFRIGNVTKGRGSRQACQVLAGSCVQHELLQCDSALSRPEESFGVRVISPATIPHSGRCVETQVDDGLMIRCSSAQLWNGALMVFTIMRRRGRFCPVFSSYKRLKA